MKLAIQVTKLFEPLVYVLSRNHADGKPETGKLRPDLQDEQDGVPIA